MKTVVVQFLATALVLSPAAGTAQAGGPPDTEFGTCAYWQDRTDPEDALYNIGLAHGFVLGIAAAPHAFIANANSGLSPSLLETYERGWSTLLARPAVLMDAFDEKCSDYRNRTVDLWDVTFLAVLEIGGAQAGRIESALEHLRAGSDRLAADNRPGLIRIFLSPS